MCVVLCYILLCYVLCCAVVLQDSAVCPGIAAGDFLSKISGQLTGAYKFSGEELARTMSLED
jgi:hypothetical protein